MATRESKLVFSQSGAEGVRARVVSMNDVLEKQARRQQELAALMPKTASGMGVIGSVAQSSSAKITSLTNTIGPLGAGLGALTRSVNPATTGLLAWASAAEKASALNRVMNVAVIGGATTMIAAGATAAAYADDLLRMSDSYETLHARIRTFADGAIDAAQKEKALFDSAKEARVGVQDLTTLYTRLAPAIGDFGKSQEDALKITQLTSKALAIQGADVREQAAATIQFSQAIASGVLRGDELRSLMESSPQLMRYIAQNLEINGKVGVAFSALRKLGEEGALTGERVVSAMLRAEALINKDFGTAPKTAQKAWQTAEDQIMRTVGTLDRVVGGQKAVVAWLEQMATKAEAFREKMLTDPDALNGVKEAGAFIGGALASIGELGEVAVKNFDLIVQAGQAVLALKIGSVMASWFAQAATGVKGLITDVKAYFAAIPMQVAKAQQPVLADAARKARADAMGADIKAAEALEKAEQKAALATAARTAADKASAQVATLKAAATVEVTAVTAAEAAATELNEQAEKAETAAKVANARATDLAAAASAKSVIATEAEALATGNVTKGMTAKALAMKGVAALYNLLGGAIGVATLALAGVTWAIMEAKKAEDAHYEALRRSIDVTDQMRAKTEELTTAAWASIPAILAQNEALRRGAEIKERETRKKIDEDKTKLAEIKALIDSGTVVEGREGLVALAGVLEKRIRRLEAAAGDAAYNKSSLRDRAYEDSIVVAVRNRQNAEEQLQRGTNAAGVALTGADRKQLLAVVESSRVYLSGEVVKLQKAQAKADAEAKVAAPDKAVGIVSYSKERGRLIEVASQGAQPYRPLSAPPPVTPKTPKVSVPGGVVAAYNDLLKSNFLQLKGGEGYAAKDGAVTKDGKPLLARSEDEAAALTRYVKIVESLKDATDAQIKKEAEKLGVTARSKEELKLAAGATLDNELANSKATQAGRRWQDMQDQMNGTTRAYTKAKEDVLNLEREGADVTDEARAAYLAYAKGLDQAAQMAEKLQKALPLVRSEFERALAGSVEPANASGGVDEARAVERVQAAKRTVLLRAEQAIEEDIARKRAEGGINEAQLDKERTDRMIGYRVAAEVEAQDRILAIRQEAMRRDAEELERQARQTSDAIVGALKDVSFGGDMKDVGKRLGMDILSAIYDELIGNPLRFAIQSAIRNLVSNNGGGGGSFWKTLLNVGASFVTGGANLSSTVSATIAANPNLFADGRVPKFASGRQPTMDGPFIKGRGTPRGDSNLAWLSDKEAVINAISSQHYADILRQINAGTYNPAKGVSAYAAGYTPPGSYPPPQAAAGPGELHVHNHGEPMKITARRDERGATHIDMKPLADSVVRSAAHSGALGRAQREQRQPKLRG